MTIDPTLSTLRALARVAAIASAAAFAGHAGAADAPPPSPLRVPAGDYTLDKAHSSLVFRVSHLGFSSFTGRFARFDAKLFFDPTRPTAARLDVTVDPRSIESDNPPSGFLAMLQGSDWLDAERYPEMKFRSTRVTSLGGRRLRVRGDLTLHGTTKPVEIIATFNGGYAGHPMDPQARIGFSARSRLKRSDFGISLGIPAPGSQMGVGDVVELFIETEFSGPPLPGSAAASQPSPR
jgi:polyisoprenoid-binding protein YceI